MFDLNAGMPWTMRRDPRVRDHAFVNPPYERLRGVKVDAMVVDDPQDPETAAETARRETIDAFDDGRGNVR